MAPTSKTSRAATQAKIESKPEGQDPPANRPTKTSAASPANPPSPAQPSVSNGALKRVVPRHNHLPLHLRRAPRFRRNRAAARRLIIAEQRLQLALKRNEELEKIKDAIEALRDTVNEQIARQQSSGAPPNIDVRKIKQLLIYFQEKIKSLCNY